MTMGRKVRSQPLLRFTMSSLETLALTALGTAALVGAHHLGRKQSNPNAQLRDYLDGVHAYGSTFVKGCSSTHRKGILENQNNKCAERHVNHTIQSAYWVSGVADIRSNDFAVVGIDADRNIVWHTPMLERIHDILVQPTPQSPQAVDKQITVMGRRPSERFWVLASDSGNVMYTISADPQRHFYGHACYSLDGQRLYVTENDTETFAGVIGVYDAALGYKKITEFKTNGIGPHELVMHPDGNTLVIANGGIKTEKASREELNIDSMQPSLVYIDRHSGQILEQVSPKHNQMSIRHLSIHKNGTVAIGIQFQGDRHLSIPLVLTHQKGNSELTPLKLPQTDTKGWHRFHHYIASVVVDSTHNLLCVTSPIGGCSAIFDLASGLMIAEAELADCAGASIVTPSTKANGHSSLPSFIVSDGQGYLTTLKLIRSALEKVERVNPKPENINIETAKMQESVSLHNKGLISNKGLTSHDASQKASQTEADNKLRKNTAKHQTGSDVKLTIDKVKLPYAFDNHMKRL